MQIVVSTDEEKQRYVAEVSKSRDMLLITLFDGDSPISPDSRSREQQALLKTLNSKVPTDDGIHFPNVNAGYPNKFFSLRLAHHETFKDVKTRLDKALVALK